jgi:hypothetical protein
MGTSSLPGDVDDIIKLTGMWVKMSGGFFAWQEQSKIKADMMNERSRWNRSRVTADALRDRCLAVGLTAEDTAKIVDWLEKTQAGKRLVPERAYRDFRFKPPPSDG